MKKSKNKAVKNKIVYNNFQFYENTLLSEYLRKQSEIGYNFSGAVGNFLGILKFSYKKNSDDGYYAAFRNDINKELSKQIENAGNIVYQNKLYTIVKGDKRKLKELEDEQNRILAISKKNLFIPGILIILSIFNVIVELIFRTHLGFDFLVFWPFKFVFLFYFIGDLYDFLIGKGKHVDEKLYFDSRSKFKNIMFRIGDILKLSSFLLSIYFSIMFAVISGFNLELTIHILCTWIGCLTFAYICRLYCHRSYIYLLLI